MNAMRRCILLLTIALLGGCADRLAERQARLTPLIGRSEAELVRTLGVPTRAYETEGVKYLAYEERRVDIQPFFPAYPYAPPFGFNQPQVVNAVCETTFSISGGVVRIFVLRGNACG